MQLMVRKDFVICLFKSLENGEVGERQEKIERETQLAKKRERIYTRKKFATKKLKLCGSSQNAYLIKCSLYFLRNKAMFYI